MMRLSRSLPALALFLAFSVAAARAQTQPSVATQTVAGAGYQFQVPADWSTRPITMVQRFGTQSVNDDGAMASPDGSQRAHVETASGFGLSSPKLPDVLAAFLGIGLGGGDTSAPAPIAALAGPDSVQVGNSESALSGAAVYMDPNGSPRVMSARIALRGDTSYMLILDVTEEFYQSDTAFAAIMNSLQLVAP